MRRLAPLLLLIATTAIAAEPQRIAVKAARLIDGRGNVTAPAVVVVNGDKIESVGGAVPPDAKVIDLGDSTLIPGLIDAHVHVLLQGDITSADYDAQLFRESLAYRAPRATQALEHARLY